MVNLLHLWPPWPHSVECVAMFVWLGTVYPASSGYNGTTCVAPNDLLSFIFLSCYYSHPALFPPDSKYIVVVVYSAIYCLTTLILHASDVGLWTSVNLTKGSQSTKFPNLWSSLEYFLLSKLMISVMFMDSTNVVSLTCYCDTLFCIRILTVVMALAFSMHQ